MLTEKEKLDALTSIGQELSQVQDLDILMEHILREARLFSNADAGSIYIKNRNRLDFKYTQNDTMQNRLSPGEKLIYNIFSIPIDCGSIAGYAALTGEILNIPDAYEISESSPFKFSRGFDEASKYRTKSILTIPLKTIKGEVMGILQIINATGNNGETQAFSEEDEKFMAHFAGIATLALDRARLTRSILLRMIQMAEMRDPKETGAHVNRVGGYAVEIFEAWAKRRDMGEKEMNQNRDMLRMAAMLHDVGKVAISDIILKKPGKFNDDEYEIMKMHTLYGARLFTENQSDFEEAAMQVALNHHERWDGRGYPGHIDINSGEPKDGFKDTSGKAIGKKGEEIPLFGRIVALADVYDALSSKRVYKEPWEENQVLDVITKESGNQFEPELVEIFLEKYNVIKSIRERYSDEDEAH